VAYKAGQTAVVVTIPEAEPVVRRWRDRYDRSASFGVPAHVTLLHPFLDATRLDQPTADQLAALCAAQTSAEVTFDRCGRFPAVLYLQPKPATPFRELTAAIASRWPDCPPYAGAYDTVVPHLTVASDVDEATMTTIERDLADHLPISSRITEASLLSFNGARWQSTLRFPFARR